MNTMKLPGYLFLLSVISITVLSCEKEEYGVLEANSTGRVRVDITDAPVDDPSVYGVFVTIAEVKIDGVYIDNLSKRMTFDLGSLREGRTLQLGSEEYLRAGVHSNIEVVLDLAKDAEGNSPGCYVLRADGSKESLAFGTNSEVVLATSEAFNVEPEGSNRFIVDLDLRKAIKRSDTLSNDLTFYSEQNVRSSTRILNFAETGLIKGSVSSNTSNSNGKIILYAYNSDRYDIELEIENDFRNAISSTIINSDGTFTIPFLLAGDYDIIAAEYADSNGDGRVEMIQLLAADAAIGLNTRSVSVSAQADVQLSLTLSSLLP